MHNEAHSKLEQWKYGEKKTTRTVHFVYFISFSNDERIIKMDRAVSSIRSQTCGTIRRKSIERRDSKMNGNNELHGTRQCYLKMNYNLFLKFMAFAQIKMKRINSLFYDCDGYIIPSILCWCSMKSFNFNRAIPVPVIFRCFDFRRNEKKTPTKNNSVF